MPARRRIDPRSAGRRAALGLVGLAAVGHIVTAALAVEGPIGELFSGPIHLGLLVVASLACLARGVVREGERAAWVSLGVGITAWTAGEMYYTFALAGLEEPPFPSIADALWLALPLASYITFGLLIRTRVPRLGGELWLDGLIGALAVAAVAAAVVFKPVLEQTGGSPAAVATNLAYPLADLLLLGFVVWVFALTGWRPGRDWLWIFAGFITLALADSIYLYRVATETYVDGEFVDALWPAAMLLLAWAAWQPRRATRPIALHGWHAVVMPLVFTCTGPALMIYGNFYRLGLLGRVLGAGAVVAAVARMGLTFREMRRLMEDRRRESVTDALTELANRRRLLADLDECFRPGSPEGSAMLTLFDLDGFKSYNDTFGHPAGDELLARIGGKLAAAVDPWGTAYRLGGDEFCALFTPGDLDPASIVAAAVTALTEHGEGFSITASYGTVNLKEVTTPTEALQRADQRMYAHKDGRAASPRYQMRDLLLKALDETQPEVHNHSSDVGNLTFAVGQRFDMSERERDDLLRAGELHDIGKLAIPESILLKTGPLNEEEWAFMRRHTLVGERILGAAAALSSVAQLVRWSHERWDGRGYPDGLAGESIPLGARIIAVCDAFSAMVSDRPYRKAMSVEAAVAELRACAGTQFDPRVVEAVAAQIAETPVLA